MKIKSAGRKTTFDRHQYRKVREKESDRILNQREDRHRGLHREMGRDRL